MKTRREFLRDSAIGVTAAAVGMTAKSYSRILGSNSRVNFAVAGLHGRGYAHLESIATSKGGRVSHICDVDERELDKFSAAMKKKYGDTPARERDVRKLLESKDLDAITIATPEHWHAPMAIMALQAGKHVYVEKPCSHNPREGVLLVEAQKKYGKLVQLGNQQRSSPHTIDIIGRIHSGLIGRPYLGKAWYCNSRTSIGVGKHVPVPDKLDWDLWQGPAPRVDYTDNVHPYNWHWFWRWGTGETLNNGTHEVDVCRWALGGDYPETVSATGGRYHFHDDWEFYDTLVTNYDYGDRMITWEGTSCELKKQYGRDRGVVIVGTEGSVVVDRSGFEVHDLEDKVKEEFKVNEKSSTQDLTSVDSMTDRHFQNLIDAIRDGEKLRSPIEEGNVSVTILQLSNIAWKLRTTLALDKKTGRVVNNPEAERMCAREYAKGWEPTI